VVLPAVIGISLGVIIAAVAIVIMLESEHIELGRADF
jgi:hypothetical protein